MHRMQVKDIFRQAPFAIAKTRNFPFAENTAASGVSNRWFQGKVLKLNKWKRSLGLTIED